jgi:hypothetical protein
MTQSDGSRSPELAAGGFIPSDGTLPGPGSGYEYAPIRVRRLGMSSDGCPIVSINDGPPEYVFTAEKVREWSQRPEVRAALEAVNKSRESE